MELIRIELQRLTGTTQIEFDAWREHDRLHGLAAGGTVNGLFRMCLRFKPESFDHIMVAVFPDNR